jgi:hypothetical protein
LVHYFCLVRTAKPIEKPIGRAVPLLACVAFLTLSHAAIAQDFQKCLDMGISRRACEDAIIATSPNSKPADDALNSAIERDYHKDDPNWEYKKSQWPLNNQAGGREPQRSRLANS